MKPLKQAIYSSRTADKFVVRLPDGMRERIAEVARTHHRSMNSEIIARLERTLVGEVEADKGKGSDKPVVSVELNGQWIPQVGQLVRTPHGAVRTIHSFMVYEDGSIEARFPGLLPEYIPLGDLKPFVLNR